MDTLTARDLQQTLERRITDLVKDFCTVTGLAVDAIEYKLHESTQVGDVHAVKVKAVL